jgi:hypothetical protein
MILLPSPVKLGFSATQLTLVLSQKVPIHIVIVIFVRDFN